jgi:arginine/ornithine transport system permease protein
MVFNFDIITQRETILLYGEGWIVTLKMLFYSLLTGFFCSLPLAVMRNSERHYFNRPVWIFTYIIRGTPLLVQLYLIYYGLSQFTFIRNSFLWPYLSSATICAWLAFAINTTAYTTEILAGSIKTTNIGEIEAARSLGMSTFTMYRRILIPSALRRGIPSYSNEVIMMLHGTSLASVVTLLDLSGAAGRVYSKYYLPFEAYITAAILYLITTFTIIWLFKMAEKKWLVHLAPRKEI